MADNKTLVQEFKEFVVRGNVVDLAVAVVVGTAFAALVKAFVADVLTPLIAAVFGKRDFGFLYFTINGSKFAYGDLINATITFLSIAAVVFLFVVKPINILMSRRAEADPSVKDCPECLSSIPVGARRCAFCGSTRLSGESGFGCEVEMGAGAR